ncbi:MAG TPA: TetR/AcrR family transcriptional regulator [Chloroflexota bacterium]
MSAMAHASAPTPRRRRPPGQVRHGLIEAGIALARAGGPEAVVLREAARHVGVAPNAAYRHFVDRDALLNAVCIEAMREMARRMEGEVARVALGYGTPEGALGRLRALGVAYQEFALTEPGLFATGFAVPRHMEYATGDAAAGGWRTPFQLLEAMLDELVTAGVLPPERRPQAEYVVWSCVHGLAMLVSQGPLRQLPPNIRTRLSELLLAFIARGL